jgi:hypothetical protein
MARVPGLYRRGNIWWCKYYVNGRPVRESTGTEKETEAKRFLDGRRGRVATGQPMLPRADRVRYDEAAADLRQHYEATGTRGLEEADYRLAHLKAFFTGRRLASIGPADATAYVAKRQAEKASNGTINRELAVLNRALRLAYENGKLLRLPVIRKLKEAAPREGFFEREAFLAVRRRLTEDLQVAVTIAYRYGWRMQSEVLSLDRRQLDLAAGTLRLDPGTTKNDEGRVTSISPRRSKCSWRPSSSAWRPSRSDSAESCRTSSRFCAVAGGQGSSGRTSARPGRRRARPQGCRGCCATTSAGRPFETWSTPGSRSAWR